MRHQREQSGSVTAERFKPNPTNYAGIKLHCRLSGFFPIAVACHRRKQLGFVNSCRTFHPRLLFKCACQCCLLMFAVDFTLVFLHDKNVKKSPFSVYEHCVSRGGVGTWQS